MTIQISPHNLSEGGSLRSPIMEHLIHWHRNRGGHPKFVENNEVMVLATPNFTTSTQPVFVMFTGNLDPLYDLKLQRTVPLSMYVVSTHMQQNCTRLHLLAPNYKKIVLLSGTSTSISKAA